MEAKKLKDTLVDEKTTALVDKLYKVLAVVEKKTLSDTMGDVKAKTLVNTVDDALAEVDDKRHGYTQLIETLINTDGHRNTSCTLSDLVNKKLVNA